MASHDRSLWPRGTGAALLASAAVFIAGLLLLLGARRVSGWPADADIAAVLLVVLLVSLIPVGLRVLDFLAANRAVIGSQWLNLDLSRVDLTRASQSTGIEVVPANMGISGPIVTDTSPMQIMDALRTASAHEVVVVDIRTGETWWVTRLLAFADGSARQGAPAAIVFTGRRGNRPDQFLGWATPTTVLGAILADRCEYATRHRRARAIAGQINVFRGSELLPASPTAAIHLHHDVSRYATPEYLDLGDAVTEQIIMDQLAVHDGTGSLEDPPDRLTLGRLGELFAAVLVTRVIDINWPRPRQVETVLAAPEPFVALVDDGRFVSMLRSADAQRAILGQLVGQAQEAAASDGR